MPLDCPDCGKAYGASDRFCTECGSPRPTSCAACGNALPPAAKFCPECGSPVAGGTSAAPSRPQSPELAPDTVANTLAAISAWKARAKAEVVDLREKVETVRGELQGDRREVVVLFADVSGYTAMSESMDPEEVTILMNDLLKDLADAVYAYEGYVDKFIGDAVMALFGAPLAHENDPERAILAGLAMQQVIEHHNRTSDVQVGLRVGINVGEVVAAHLGGKGQMQYTVLGDTVNVASRLEGKAETGSVLVSGAVYDRVSSLFSAEELPPLELKGKSEPVRAYQIVEYRGASAPAGEARQVDAPFVGREEELDTLINFLTRIGTDGSGTLLIEADPGGGKTRLVREALHRLDDPLHVVSLSLSPIQLPGQRPPATEIFSRLLADEDGPLVERALAKLGPGAEKHRTALEDLQGTLDPESASNRDAQTNADPAAARQNRWVGLAALLSAMSGEQPVVIWIEDVHWISEEASELLDFLLNRLSRAPVAFLLTTRPGHEVEWLPSDVIRIHLGPLGEEAALQLLGDLTRDLSVEQRRDLIRRSEGNPLFLEELVRALNAPDRKDTDSIPGTLQGLIKSRIDRLPPPAQSLLNMAAVLGGRFPAPLLHRMFELESAPMPFDSALAILEDESLLDVRGGTEGLCEFHHALMQEVTYSGLLNRLRRVLHESAARLGEEYYADGKEAEAIYFAHHFWYAELRDEAVPYLWIAGSTAAEGFDLQLAEKYLSRAAQVVDETPQLMTEIADRAHLEETLGNVLLHRGQLDAADERFKRLEILGDSERRSDWMARGREYRGRTAWYRDQLDRAQELFESGLDLLSGEEDRVAADLHNDLGVVFYNKNLPDRAFKEHSKSLDLRTRIDDRLGMAKSFINIGNLMFDFHDDLESAEEHYRRCLALAEEIGNRQVLCQALNNLAAVKRDRGQREEAIEAFQRAEKLLEEMGWAHARYVNLQNQADCQISLGRIEVALDHLDACMRRGDKILEPGNRINTRCLLFDAYFRALADDLAEEVLADAVKMQAEMIGNEPDRAVVLRQGRWLLARGRLKEAAEAFGRAEAIAKDENQTWDAELAGAHRRRTLILAGEPVTAGHSEPNASRKPRVALLTFLNADALATREPSPEVAESFGRVTSLAAELGDVALERSALERQAQVLAAIGEGDRTHSILQRAASAMTRLEENLPMELRERFTRHPRNEPLRKHLVGSPTAR